MINAACGGANLAGRTFQVKDFITALPEMRHSLPHVHLNSRAIEARWVADLGDDTSDYIARAFRTLRFDLFTEQTPTPAWVRDNLAIGAYLETRGVTADLQIPSEYRGSARSTATSAARQRMNCSQRPLSMTANVFSCRRIAASSLWREFV